MKELKNSKLFKAWSKLIFDERVLTYWANACMEYNEFSRYLYYKYLKLDDTDVLSVDYRKAHIIITLFFAIEETHPGYFNEAKDGTVVDKALKALLKKGYHKKLMKLMEKNIGIANYPKYFLSPVQAYRELVARGFLPYALLTTKVYNKETYYLHGAGKLLFIPIEGEPTVRELETYQRALGIMGHVGYNHPITK